MEEARALLESAERGKRQVGAGQIVLFDISGHDHLGGGGARRVQGGRQPDEHHQLKGENQCLHPRDIKNISHFGLQENLQGDFGPRPCSVPTMKKCSRANQILKSTSAATLPHQAGIELSDFHARGWKSDQGGWNSMQEMHGNQTKCMEFRPIKENSNF